MVYIVSKRVEFSIQFYMYYGGSRREWVPIGFTIWNTYYFKTHTNSKFDKNIVGSDAVCTQHAHSIHF